MQTTKHTNFMDHKYIYYLTSTCFNPLRHLQGYHSKYQRNDLKNWDSVLIAAIEIIIMCPLVIKNNRILVASPCVNYRLKIFKNMFFVEIKSINLTQMVYYISQITYVKKVKQSHYRP
jgi:hypothetical protein